MLGGWKRVSGRRGTLYSSNATFREETGNWGHDLRKRAGGRGGSEGASEREIESERGRGVENVGERERERARGWKSVEETREGKRERRERIRQAGRKEMARNILASPRAPSCVLNHFPVDSAVCNPIIGVSPPGKLLFYSRTTRAPDVLSLVYRDIPPPPSPPPTPLLFACFPWLVSLVSASADRVSTSPGGCFFFFLLDRLYSYAQFCAPVRLFRSIRPLSP